MKDLVANENPSVTYVQGVDFFSLSVILNLNLTENLIRQSTLLGYHQRLDMDPMLSMADITSPQEIPEALKALRVKLGPTFAQVVRFKVIFDMHWRGGI